MGLARQIRRLRRRRETAATKKRRRALIEPLEPQLLLSADLSYTMTGTVKDLSVELDQVGGVDMIRLVNSDDLVLQADMIYGDGGDDLIIGDNALIVTPAAATVILITTS